MARNNTKQKGKGSKGQNKKNSIEFFKKNKTKKGVVETKTGLQYIAKVEGSGAIPDLNSTIEIHQRISLIDGSLIADTYKNDETEEFSMNEAIEGLKEGICLMNEGSKYKFFVPPELAWGKRGAGDKIGPFATLVFDIKLIKVL